MFMVSVFKNVTNQSLIREKDGVFVYRCDFRGKPAVLKYFENKSYRREILNYQILNKIGVKTIKLLDFSESFIVMEDVNASLVWRLGLSEDLGDLNVAKGLASWYFDFHEKGLKVEELSSLYCEYDEVTNENIRLLATKLPEVQKTFDYIISNYENLVKLIKIPEYTLTYNDFYYTNFIVKKDKQEAFMFDYNFLGKGFRYSDIRNVCSSLTSKAAKVFTAEYNKLYFEKHGKNRVEEEALEKQINDVISCLFTLIKAYERDTFPSWASEEREKALNGDLLKNTKKLFGGA